jgi:sortase A
MCVSEQTQVKTAQNTFQYVVESIEIVTPNDTQVLQPTGRRLTLVTCFPFYFPGPAPKRFIVRAREVDQTLRQQIAKH